MTSTKLFDLPPKIICLYLLLAITSSSIWFAGFTLQILNRYAESPNWFILLLGCLLQAMLIVVYFLHFTIVVCLPISSRLWLCNLESKRSTNFLEIFMIVMGYDEEHWGIGGSRSVSEFVVTLIPFLLPIKQSGWGIMVIVALAVEAFFLVETVKHTDMKEGFFYATVIDAFLAARRVFGYSSRESVKHTEMEEGFFYAAMVGTFAAARLVFGYSSRESVLMIFLCEMLIFFHSLFHVKVVVPNNDFAPKHKSQPILRNFFCRA